MVVLHERRRRYLGQLWTTYTSDKPLSAQTAGKRKGSNLNHTAVRILRRISVKIVECDAKRAKRSSVHFSCTEDWASTRGQTLLCSALVTPSDASKHIPLCTGKTVPVRNLERITKVRPYSPAGLLRRVTFHSSAIHIQ